MAVGIPKDNVERDPGGTGLGLGWHSEDEYMGNRRESSMERKVVKASCRLKDGSRRRLVGATVASGSWRVVGDAEAVTFGGEAG